MSEPAFLFGRCYCRLEEKKSDSARVAEFQEQIFRGNIVKGEV